MEVALALYFERVNPVFPVFVGTTIPNPVEEDPLLLALCSVGALFINSERAFNHSLKLFEQVCKLLVEGWSPTVQLLQAAVVTQAYNLLAGKQKDRELEKFLHDKLAAWAQQSSIPSENTTGQSNLRCLIYIQEGEMNMDSCRHGCGNNLLPNNAFTFDDEGQFWLQAYASLEKLCSEVHGNRRETASISRNIIQELINWYKARQVQLTKTPDPFCSTILFHSLFISIFSDIELLEKAVGRDGVETAVLIRPQAQQWAGSDNSIRSVIHCSIMQKYFELLPIEEEPAIHLPRSLYQAAIVWYAYVVFKSPVPRPLKSSYDFPELCSLGVNCNSHLRHVDKQGFLKFISLAKRLGPWRITRIYETVLSTLADSLVYGTTCSLDPWGSKIGR
ncbi:hypothetical protein TRICI_003685 [Trichomonascus ciferrii]|uniref:Transcription factor domain-containing protein n=1 Tax=Trichomonascus ciferrii TaxID=44093 RepID=A0A642V4F0_9ASCO|nr:hypothetical protein TRICI_003685 [Trichomonascus ciferrii]